MVEMVSIFKPRDTLLTARVCNLKNIQVKCLIENIVDFRANCLLLQTVNVKHGAVQGKLFIVTDCEC